MKRALLIAAVLVAVLPAVFADEGDRTNKMYNGRFWRSLSTEGKLSYMIGYDEGYTVALFASHKEVAAAMPLIEAHVVDATFGELIEMLDRLYSVPENRNIMIVTAIRLVKEKTRGLSQSEFDAKVESLRKAQSRLSNN